MIFAGGCCDMNMADTLDGGNNMAALWWKLVGVLSVLLSINR